MKRVSFLLCPLCLLLLWGCSETEKVAKKKEAAGPKDNEAKAPVAVEPIPGEDVAIIETPKGKIALRFFDTDAPETVAELKRLIGGGFYDGTTFHRVIAGRLIQGGDPLSRDLNPYNDGQGNSGRNLAAEFNQQSFRRGTVGLARGLTPDSGSCQFFICLARNKSWDGSYTAFAEVIEGIEVAETISKVRTNPKADPRLRARPIREQRITQIRLEKRQF